MYRTQSRCTFSAEKKDKAAGGRCTDLEIREEGKDPTAAKTVKLIMPVIIGVGVIRPGAEANPLMEIRDRGSAHLIRANSNRL